MPIRYRKNDNDLLNKEVKNFNRRLNTLIKSKKIDPSLLPEKMSVKKIKNSIENRQEFNKQIKALKEFRQDNLSIKYTESGGAYTNWTEKRIKEKIKLVNRRKDKEYEKYPHLKSTRQSMQKPTDIKYDFSNKSIEDIKKFEKMLDKRLTRGYYDIRNEQLRQNFISALNTVYGDTNTIVDLKDIINNMNIDDFIKMFYGDERISIDDYIYDMLVDSTAKIDNLKDIFSEFKNET